jgi:hypothetical protein
MTTNDAMTPRTTAGPPTICKCGSAKAYHRPQDKRDHDYEPRYEPMAWSDGYRRGAEAAAPLRDALRGLVAAEDGLLVVTSDHAKEEWEVALDAARRALDEPIEYPVLDREVEG